MTRTYLTCVECMNELTDEEIKSKLIAFGIHGKGIMCKRCYYLNTKDIASALLRALKENTNLLNIVCPKCNNEIALRKVCPVCHGHGQIRPPDIDVT